LPPQSGRDPLAIEASGDCVEAEDVTAERVVQEIRAAGGELRGVRLFDNKGPGNRFPSPAPPQEVQ
jgi:hypothetical protein